MLALADWRLILGRARYTDMHNGAAPTILRRSSRIPTALQILVTSLEGTHFSEVCETLVVNAHGCAILTRVKFDTGVPLNLHSKDGRETTAHVVTCQPIGSDQVSWRLGAQLDRPENFWGLKDCPKDWVLPAPVAQRPPQILKSTNTSASQQSSGQENQPSEAVRDRVARQLEEQVRRMIAESVRPLQAEVMALRERVAQREANPSRFEVSLSKIPPELNNRSSHVCERTSDQESWTRRANSLSICWNQPRQRLTSELPKATTIFCAGSGKSLAASRNVHRTFPRTSLRTPGTTCVAGWKIFSRDYWTEATPSNT